MARKTSHENKAYHDFLLIAKISLRNKKPKK